MPRVVLKVGECFEIPLPSGRKAYAQYILRDNRKPGGLGTLIQVFDIISDHPVELQEVQTAGALFPPVYVGLQATVRSGRWRRIGWLPVSPFEFPLFRRSWGTKPGTYHDWRIGDGQKWEFVGDLPVACRSLEMWVVWGDELLENRIASGTTTDSSIL